MELISKLYQSSHRLLHLGEDGSPVYANEFSALNDEVHRLADKLFPLSGSTAEAEASLCIALLMGYSATIYDDGSKNEKKQKILDRAFAVMDLLPPAILKCRLLLYCYAEVYAPFLIDEVRQIFFTWKDSKLLTPEENELVDFYNVLMENPNSQHTL